MGHLYLVRHAQASFGADDYDQLSPLGMKQSQRLGEYLHGKGLKFDAVYTGTLRRHGQTLQGISEGMQWTPEDVQRLPGLNEYDSEAVLAMVRETRRQLEAESPVRLAHAHAQLATQRRRTTRGVSRSPRRLSCAMGTILRSGMRSANGTYSPKGTRWRFA